MNTLIVGGTGLVGATTAKYLAEHGYNITLMSRSKPNNPELENLAFIQGDYINDEVTIDVLCGFDYLVFAAGADLRHQPKTESDKSFFTRANTQAIPRFFNLAKKAGIKRAVYIGSYYPQVVPEKINTSPYVKSRHLADEAIRRISDENFCVCSLNAPFVIGHFNHVATPHLKALVQYCAGRIKNLPLVAPAGGVNHISAQSVAEAIKGALERGQCGHAYLIGDENLSWKTYFELFCEAVGNPKTLAISTEEHPMLPDIILYAGRNATINYTPENAPLNYSTQQIKRTIESVVKAYL